MIQNKIDLGGKVIGLGSLIPALITPMDQGRTDFASLEKVVDHVLVPGVNSVVILGNTAEFQYLDLVQAKQIVAQTAKFAENKKFTPIVNITRPKSVEEAIDLSKYASELGLFVQMIAPLYVWNDRPHVIMRKILEETDGRTRFMIYENKDLYKEGTSGLDHFFISHYAQGNHPKVIGVKFSTFDQREFELVAALRTPQFFVYIGNDSLVNNANKDKANGLITGTACHVPKDVVFYWNKVGKAATIQEFAHELEIAGAGDYISGLKSFLKNENIINSAERVKR